MARPARKLNPGPGSERKGTQRGDRQTLVLDWIDGYEFRLAQIQTDHTVKAIITALLRRYLAEYVRANGVISRHDAEKIYSRRHGPRLRRVP